MIKKFIGGLILASLMITTLPVLAADPVASTNQSTGLVCVQTAVDKRDTAIMTAFSAFSTSIANALQVRKNALKAGWGITDGKQRRLAIKTAWSDFGLATKTARRTLNQSRDAAWNQFKTDAKSCKTQGAPTSDDDGSKAGDVNL